MRSAIIADGIVVNIIKGQIEGSIACGDDVGLGWTYDAGLFVPPEPAPEAVPDPTPEDPLAQARENRASAYRVEADPLFFKWQRGEGSKQDWLDKVAKIRQLYPYPKGPGDEGGTQ